jgi:hypothetical protein
MSWTAEYIYVDGENPDADNLNYYVRDKLKYLHGDGESVTARDKLLLAPGFQATAAALYLKRTYSSSGATYRFVGEKTDSPTALANGQKLRLVLKMRPSAGLTERLGLFEVERTGTGAGKISYYPYLAGTLATVPAFVLDSAGRLLIGRASGSYALDVDGPIRAAAYLIGGSAIGQWILAGRTMTFDGDAEVTGALIAGGHPWGDGAAQAPFQCESQTKNTNLNVPTLRGYGWPAKKTAATPAPVPIYESSGDPSTLVSRTVDRAGFYSVTCEASMPITVSSGFPGLGLFAPGEFESGESVIGIFASSNVIGDIVHAKNVYRVRVDTPSATLSTRVRVFGQAVGAVSGSLVARWLAPVRIIQVASSNIGVSEGSPTVTIT